ncbi:MAG: hypothetical protein AAF902_13675 [Chloroflexota bacterium]
MPIAEGEEIVDMPGDIIHGADTLYFAWQSGVPTVASFGLRKTRFISTNGKAMNLPTLASLFRPNWFPSGGTRSKLRIDKH